MRHARLLILSLKAVVFLSAFSLFGADTTFQDKFRSPEVLWISGPGGARIIDGLSDAMRVRFTFQTTRMGDLEAHHLTDKPLEETRESQEILKERNKRRLEKLIANLEKFDVLVLSVSPEKFDKKIKKRIVAWIKNGGKMIYYVPHWEITFKTGEPLSEVMPVKSSTYKHKAWNYGQLGATTSAFSRGLPLEVLGNHFYGPIYEPADSTVESLTIQRPGKKLTPYKKIARFFHWQIGKKNGAVVFLPTLLFASKSSWNSGSYATYHSERPDDTMVWKNFLKRMIFTMTFGSKAYPVLLELNTNGANSIIPGKSMTIGVNAENMSKNGSGDYIINLNVDSGRLGTVAKLARKIHLNPGEKKKIDFSILASNLPVSNIRINANASLPDGTVVSKALTWLSVKQAFKVSLKTDKTGYLSSEKIDVTGTIKPHPTSGKTQIEALLVDFEGNVYQRRKCLPSELSKDGEWKFSFKMPTDQSGRQYSWWITLVISEDGNPVTVQRAQVYNDDPWSMRKQLQFSVWSAGTHTLGSDVMRLYEDSGINSLGFQGTPYWAERYGWRRYDEGTGINTFGVTIDYATPKQTKKMMTKIITDLNKSSISSRSLALVSLGEESGFKGGWGTRYYWKGDSAPPIPQKVFDDYLENLYNGDIQRLNEEWGSDYKSFAAIPLTKKLSRGPKIVPISGQAYANDTKEKEWKLRVDVENVDAAKKYLARTAPYLETYHFYDWYYQRYCDWATEVFRRYRNPVARTIMSAPGGFYPKVDVYNFHGIGPFHTKERGLAENESARMAYGDIPGFSGAIWAYFDLYRLWNCEIFSYLAAGNSHIDYWVDFPLTFNYDMSKTRAAFWTKRFRSKIKKLEPLMLSRRVFYTPGLGIYTGRQPMPKGVLGKFFQAGVSPNTAIYSAFEESGYFPQFITSDKLKKMKVVVASYAEVVSPKDAEALKKFVSNGGLLITTPWFASHTSHGNCLSVYPSAESGLEKLLGFKLLNTSQKAQKEIFSVTSSDTLPLNSDSKKKSGLNILSSGKDKILDMKKDVRTLASFADGTPAILERRVGNGKVIHFNFVFCWNGWWTTLFTPEREAFRRLILAILDKNTAMKNECDIAFKSYDTIPQKGWWGTKGLKKLKNWKSGDAVPHWATTCYTDQSGVNKYFFIYSDHRAPKISAEIQFPVESASVFDAFNGKKLARNADGAVPLTLDAGEGTILALIKRPPAVMELQLPATIEPGSALPIEITLAPKTPSGMRGIIQAIGFRKNASGDYGVVVKTTDSNGNTLTPLSLANCVIKNGKGTVRLMVPMNQNPGVYKLKVVNSATGLSAERKFTVSKNKTNVSRKVIQPFTPLTRHTVIPMTPEEFIKNLNKLETVYMTPHSGLDAKYKLSYFIYVPFMDSNRHSIMHQLAKQSWANYVEPVGDALRKGARFHLTGEDLGLDPQSGLKIDNNAPDKSNFLDLLAKLPGATCETRKIDDRTITVITIGNGKLIYDPISLTRFYLSKDFMEWHKHWLKAIKNL